MRALKKKGQEAMSLNTRSVCELKRADALKHERAEACSSGLAKARSWGALVHSLTFLPPLLLRALQRDTISYKQWGCRWGRAFETIVKQERAFVKHYTVGATNLLFKANERSETTPCKQSAVPYKQSARASKQSPSSYNSARGLLVESCRVAGVCVPVVVSLRSLLLAFMLYLVPITR